MNIFPTWIVEFWPRRPTLTRPRQMREIDRVEVGQCSDREAAAAAFSRQYPQAEIISISMGSIAGLS